MLIQLSALFQDYNPKHSKYQIENYIIGLNGSTQYGQYKQALRELYPRFLNIKKGIVRVAEMEAQEEDPANIPDEGTKKYDLYMAKKGLNVSLLVEAKNNLEYQIKEFKHFYSIATQIKSDLGELTAEIIDQKEKEFWVQTFKEKLALEVLGSGRPSQGTLETILAMPERDELIAHLAGMQAPQGASTYLLGLPNTIYEATNLIEDSEVLELVQNTTEIKTVENIKIE
jgi:hypothetical protein